MHPPSRRGLCFPLTLHDGPDSGVQSFRSLSPCLFLFAVENRGRGAAVRRSSCCLVLRFLPGFKPLWRWKQRCDAELQLASARFFRCFYRLCLNRVESLPRVFFLSPSTCTCCCSRSLLLLLLLFSLFFFLFFLPERNSWVAPLTLTQLDLLHVTHVSSSSIAPVQTPLLLHGGFRTRDVCPGTPTSIRPNGAFKQLPWKARLQRQSEANRKEHQFRISFKTIFKYNWKE